jgi:hypothetical protein
MGANPYGSRVSWNVWNICDVKTKKPVFIGVFDRLNLQIVNEYRGI